MWSQNALDRSSILTWLGILKPQGKPFSVFRAWTSINFLYTRRFGKLLGPKLDSMLPELGPIMILVLRGIDNCWKSWFLTGNVGINTCHPDMLKLRHEFAVEAAKSLSCEEPTSLLCKHVIHPARGQGQYQAYEVTHMFTLVLWGGVL